MRKLVLLAVVVLVASMVFVVCAQEEKKPEMKEADPVAEFKGSVERGKALFNDPKLGTTGQTCNTCHMKGGTVAGKMGDMDLKAFDALNAAYPKYWMMAKKVMTLDQVVNWCITTPLKGEALAWDDMRLTDLVAYCASVTPAKPEIKKEEAKGE